MYQRIVAQFKFWPYYKIILRTVYFINPWNIWVFVAVPIMGYSIAFQNRNADYFLKAIVIATIMLLLIPSLVYFSARKNFYTKGKFTGPVVFETTDERMTVTDTSRSISYRWDDDCYMIKEFKNWLVLYKKVKTLHVAVEIIPKEAFTPEQLNELKTGLSAQSHLVQKWRK
ncbi:MAG TPA: YcxB family protein [Bacteroidia bacterium]|nr:YcxB family protein [Bacteroidia bacterium]